MNEAKLQAGLLPAIVCLVALFLAACDGGSGNVGAESAESAEGPELRRFVAEAVNRPAGPVEPLPTFIAYQPFAYSAAALRSPFQSPLEAGLRGADKLNSEIQPDLTRPREPLENFALSSLTLVGTLAQSGKRWALIRDGEGKVQRVTAGHYLGHDHGRIAVVAEDSLSLVEIVTQGEGRWVESPRILSMEGAAR